MELRLPHPLVQSNFLLEIQPPLAGLKQTGQRFRGLPMRRYSLVSAQLLVLVMGQLPF
jgi:hypothetical protein